MVQTKSGWLGRAGCPNWGKDNGYIIHEHQPGVPLGGFRQVRVRCYANGQWRESSQPLASVFPGDRVFQPNVFASGEKVWLAVKLRDNHAARAPEPSRVTTFPVLRWAIGSTGSRGWMAIIGRCPFALPASKGRDSTRLNAAWDGSGNLWMTWPTDNRQSGDYHRPLRQQVYAGRLQVRDGSGAAGAEGRVARAAPRGETRPCGRAWQRARHPCLHGHRRWQDDAHRAWRFPPPHRAELGPRRRAGRLLAGFLPLHDRRGVDGLRRLHRPPGRRLALLVVVHARR